MVRAAKLAGKGRRTAKDRGGDDAEDEDEPPPDVSNVCVPSRYIALVLERRHDWRGFLLFAITFAL